MFTVHRLHDCPGPDAPDVPVGEFETADELLALLDGRHGTFRLARPDSPRAVRLKLEAPVSAENAAELVGYLDGPRG